MITPDELEEARHRADVRFDMECPNCGVSIGQQITVGFKGQTDYVRLTGVTCRGCTRSYTVEIQTEGQCD